MSNLNRYDKYANWLIKGGITIIVISILLFTFKVSGLNFSGNINTVIFDHFGSFIGGLVGALFSLAGVYLLILNLRSQEIDIKRQQIENRFFELIKIHRENCLEIKVPNNKIKGESEIKGREVFGLLQREFYNSFALINKMENPDIQKLNLGEKINIAYISFFFGAAGKHTSNMVRKYLDNYNDEILNVIVVEYSKMRSEYDKVDIPYQIFSGHHSRLGHYFRHLYQTVNYIDNQPTEILDYKKKYEYIKTLRAQLSTQEQVLFFFNSLSTLGKNWELSDSITENKQLITKYNLIKNIPDNYISILDIKDFYPDCWRGD